MTDTLLGAFIVPIETIAAPDEGKNTLCADVYKKNNKTTADVYAGIQNPVGGGP